MGGGGGGRWMRGRGRRGGVGEGMGVLGIKGVVGVMGGSEAMCKAANVEMVGWDKVGGGLVTAIVRGDVGGVKAAVDAGAEAAGRVGELIASHVIARPHPDL